MSTTVLQPAWSDTFKALVNQPSEQQRQAFARLQQAGLPNRRHERFKYSPLAELQRGEFQAQRPQLTADNQQLTAKQLRSGYQPVVIIDGIYRDDLFANTLNVSSDTSGDMRVYSGVVDHQFPDHLLDLNFAFNAKALTILIDKPTQILYISSGAHRFDAIRLQLQIAANQQVELIEQQFDLAQSTGFTQIVSAIELADNANLAHTRLLTSNNSSMMHTTVTLNRDSHYQQAQVITSEGYSRQETRLHCKQPGATAMVQGAYCLHGNAQADIYLSSQHDAANCQTQQLIKGVAAGSAKAIFNGQVIVANGANNSQSFQKNDNIVLSNKAQVYAKPELQIYHDDVQCSHGVTVGEMDEESIFYCQARGLDANTAKQLLLEGFMMSTLDNLSDKRFAVDQLTEHLTQKLLEVLRVSHA